MNKAITTRKDSSIVYAVTLYDGERESVDLFRTEESGRRAFEAAVRELQNIARLELGEHHAYELERRVPSPNYDFAGISIYWATLTQKRVYS